MKSLKLALLLTFLQASAVAQAMPAGVSALPSFQLRVFHSLNPRFQGFFEGAITLEREARTVSTLTLGSYFPLLDWLRSGLFLRRESGAIYPTLWDDSAQDWRSASSRFDTQVIADLTPRWLLAGNWVAEVRLRGIYGFDSTGVGFRVRPGITHVFEETSPLSPSLFLQTEAYFWNAQGQLLLNEWGAYLGTTLPLSNIFQPGFSLQWRKIPSPTQGLTVSEDSLLFSTFLILRMP